MVAISLPVLLGVGWVLSAILLASGWMTRRRALFGWGVIDAGLMVLLSPLSVYLDLAVVNGTFPAAPINLLVLAAFAFLGGVITTVGASYLRTQAPR